MATRGTATRASARTKAATTAPVTSETSTRATRARIITSTAKSTSTQAPAKKAVARKPLANKGNENEVENIPKAPSKALSQKSAKPIDLSMFTDREPIMAYLRIRPHQNEDNVITVPYLTPLSDTTVRMTDPQESQSNAARYRISTVPPSSLYTFSHVFPPNSTQSDFFSKTTLPLVRDVLMGQSGLLFTYGVTNSGKTYTIQGGTTTGSAGILPRTLDVLFNSIDGLHGEGRYRPVRLFGIETADHSDLAPHVVSPAPAIAEMLGPDLEPIPELDIDPTVIPVDRNYEYTIFISYAEVYNEKVYDLLESVKDDSSNLAGDAIGVGRKSLVLKRKALALKSSPAADAVDSGATGKYIAGLKQFHVHSASQAKALVKLGQLHRRVFGTLANRESSRSHGMVIIKVMRGHKGDRDDPTCLQIARLTLVDLAGSERTKHTQTTGDRLKEAGNINKSLMVLGQCMEVMRSNQRKLAASLSQTLTMDTRDVRKGLAVVPFRHSKLTEALMDYFTGDGRTVMIVNVNPFDTGYDENSHVMKFAALAREVYISPTPAPVQRMPTLPPLNPTKATRTFVPLTPKDQNVTRLPQRRQVTVSIKSPGRGQKINEAVVEVLEEDEPNNDSSDDDDEPINPLVDALFDEVEMLRMRLYEAEMKCAIVEAETREEVMREMEERMQSMEAIHSRRLMTELERHELKTDAKIDMIHQSGLFSSPLKRPAPVLADVEEVHEEEDVERSLIMEQADEEQDQPSRSPSPLAVKGKVGTSSSSQAIDENDFESELSELESGDDWIPSVVKQTASKNASRRSSRTSRKASQSSTSGNGRVSKLEEEIGQMTLDDNVDPDDSVVIVPVKNRPKKSLEKDEMDEDSDGVKPGPKKKKRLLGKKPIITEDEIERVTDAVDRVTGNVPPRRFRSSGGR